MKQYVLSKDQNQKSFDFNGDGSFEQIPQPKRRSSSVKVFPKIAKDINGSVSDEEEEVRWSMLEGHKVPLRFPVPRNNSIAPPEIKSRVDSLKNPCQNVGARSVP